MTPKDERGIFRLSKSFKYAYHGLKEAHKTEQTVWIFIPVALLVIVMGFIFKINTTEWIVVILILGIIYSFELINTALEATVDLASPKIHPLAKKAKDTMSAAVLLFAITSVIIGLIIFLPKILVLF